MTPLPDILAWVASHSSRLSRAGYTAPNPAANGRVRLLDGSGQQLVSISLDSQCRAGGVTLEDDVKRIEIYASNGDLLFTEQE